MSTFDPTKAVRFTRPSRSRYPKFRVYHLSPEQARDLVGTTVWYLNDGTAMSGELLSVQPYRGDSGLAWYKIQPAGSALDLRPPVEVLLVFRTKLDAARVAVRQAQTAQLCAQAQLRQARHEAGKRKAEEAA